MTIRTAQTIVPVPVKAKPTVPAIQIKLISTVQNFLLALRSLAAPIRGMETIAKILLAAITVVQRSVAQEASSQITLTK